jgi:predicted RNA-binding protein Jag
MKSIIHEASSIAKAVEQGWIKAGKPQEFSVKVFEDAEKNFFGFTTKQAKVAIFFKDVNEGNRNTRSHHYQQRPDKTKEENVSKNVSQTTNRTDAAEKKTNYTQRRRRRRPASPTVTSDKDSK